MVGFYQIYGLCKSHPINIQTINRNDNVDEKIDELISDKYNTIIVSNSIAGASEKINTENCGFHPEGTMVLYLLVFSFWTEKIKIQKKWR
mgnify:CR=1 FL=1